MRQIYLDYNATTPIAPSVTEAMTPFFSSHFGNPSSAHSLGRAARESIQDARSKLANWLGCDSSEIIFTSGGTESNNLALKGVMLAGGLAGGHFLISAIEHPSVVQPARFLERMGAELTIIDCNEHGFVDPQTIRSALQSNTRLVSVMHANNEIGTVQSIKEIASICHQQNVLVHTDASQSAGKIPVNVEELGIDLLTIAGHKLYAPKGVGAIFVREGLSLEPVMHGASHENGIRAGTENLPYIIGLAQAAYLANRAMDDASAQMESLRDRLEKLLVASILGLKVNGAGVPRLPNTLSVSFPDVSGQELLKLVPELCASTGSACHSDGIPQSSTLQSMGCTVAEIAGTVRLSLGWQTSGEEIDLAASLLIDAWEKLL